MKFITLILSLTVLPSIYSMDNVRRLADLAGAIVSKKLDSINDLPMPVECQHFLGLVELRNKAENIETQPNGARRIIDGKEFLDITAKEPRLNKTFVELIEEKNFLGLYFVLAVITTKNGNGIRYHYRDANTLNKALFGQRHNDNEPQSIRKLPFLQFLFSEYLNVLDDEPLLAEIICDIEYFIITSRYDLKAQVLKTADKLKGLGNAIAQNDVAFWYNEQGNIEQAIFYYTHSANQGHAIAQNSLGILYKKEGNIEQAKHYLSLVANQGYAIAQNNLGFLYLQEGNIEKAKHYYKLAADQGYAKAQCKLKNILRD